MHASPISQARRMKGSAHLAQKLCHRTTQNVETMVYRAASSTEQCRGAGTRVGRCLRAGEGGGPNIPVFDAER